MAKVFISHAAADGAAAQELHRGLDEHGHEVFVDIDRNVGVNLGEVWEERLYERLRWADVMVCLVTSEYVKGRWCFAEIMAAKALGKRLLPLSAEVDVHHPLIEGIQHSDYALNPRGPGRADRCVTGGRCLHRLGLAGGSLAISTPARI